MPVIDFLKIMDSKFWSNFQNLKQEYLLSGFENTLSRV